MLQEQTVAAIATPAGQGGIAVIRLSGTEAYPIAAQVFRPQNKTKDILSAAGYTAMFGTFVFRGSALDEGIALCFRAPHSYTGEDVVELSCHGGEQVSQELLLACFEAGAVPAPAGEFTKRAMLNGRISLTQAEAVMDIITATSRQGVAVAKASLSGALYQDIAKQKDKLVALASHLAAYTDYPEEDVDTLTVEEFIAVLQDVCSHLEGLIEGYNRGSILRRGVATVIVGSPNVGKSTLFNLLSGFERAIVTSVAGTTRDVVREQIQIGGISLHLADTAGLHHTQDEVEAEGIRRSYQEMEQASLIIAVFDGSVPLNEAEWELVHSCKGRIAVAIINKSDLGTAVSVEALQPYFSEVVVTSAKEENSRQMIEKAVLQVLKLQEIDTDTVLLANQRQLSATVAAVDALKEAEKTLLEGFTFDAAGVYLEDALQALYSLTGENASESVIEEIFARFCVGK